MPSNEHRPANLSTEDVLVDRRGNIYITNKQRGLFILLYTGPDEAAPTAQQEPRAALKIDANAFRIWLGF